MSGPAFRPMTPDEIAKRDRRLASHRRRLDGPEKIGHVFWMARAAALGIPVDVSAAMWESGYVVARVDEITPAAAQEVLR